MWFAFLSAFKMINKAFFFVSLNVLRRNYFLRFFIIIIDYIYIHLHIYTYIYMYIYMCWLGETPSPYSLFIYIKKKTAPP